MEGKFATTYRLKNWEGQLLKAEIKWIIFHREWEVKELQFIHYTKQSIENVEL